MLWWEYTTGAIDSLRGRQVGPWAEQDCMTASLFIYCPHRKNKEKHALFDE